MTPSLLKIYKIYSENFFMKREISLWTEWAWMNGILSSERQSVDSSAHVLALALQKKFPKQFGSLDKSLEALSEHITQTLKKLTYGQKSPEDLHPLRRSYLETLNLSTTHLNF